MNAIKISRPFVHRNFSGTAKKAVALLLLLSLPAGLAGCGHARSQDPDPSTTFDEPYRTPDTSVSGTPDTSVSGTPEGRFPDTSLEDAPPDIHSPEDFYAVTVSAFLGDAAGENRVYSPLNVYMALAMLAEITEGESREQVLTLLGEDGQGDLEPLRAYVASLWNDNYREDEFSTILPAASFWINENLSVREDVADTLSASHRASVHQGRMGSAEFDREFQQWLNDQTGGLLEQQAARQGFSDATILALATTLYFKAGWADEFRERNTAPDVFHGDSEDVTHDFMNGASIMNYYRGDHFAAVGLGFSNGCKMWFLLPDEDSSVEELLQDESGFTKLVLNPGEWEDVRRVTVNLSLPKFDVVSDMELSGLLTRLGVRDVFDPYAADFAVLSDDGAPSYLSSVDHAARVKIDEKGCEAAAFTVMMRNDAIAMRPAEEVDFIANRPFLFAITGAGNVPLFTGVVNRP